MQLLEEQTRDRVAAELRSLEVQPADGREHIERSMADADEAATRPWLDMIQTTLEIEPPAIEGYRKLERVAVESDVAHALIEHGEALMAFCRRELDADATDTLEPIVSILTADARALLAHRS